jgi:hypothetical protein
MGLLEQQCLLMNYRACNGRAETFCGWLPADGVVKLLTLSGICENLRPASTYLHSAVITRPCRRQRRLTANNAKGGSTSHCNIGEADSDIVGIHGA